MDTWSLQRSQNYTYNGEKKAASTNSPVGFLFQHLSPQVIQQVRLMTQTRNCKSGSSYPPTICISYFSVVDIKHYGRKQLIEEFLLTYSPRGIGVCHDRQRAWGLAARAKAEKTSLTRSRKQEEWAASLRRLKHSKPSSKTSPDSAIYWAASFHLSEPLVDKGIRGQIASPAY